CMHRSPHCRLDTRTTQFYPLSLHDALPIFIDVPELGYFGTDHPHPRGELLVKTTSMIPGYYKRPDVTAAMFDEDGFYRTGDIVRSEEHTSELQSRENLVCRLLLEKKNKTTK